MLIFIICLVKTLNVLKATLQNVNLQS